MDILDEDVKEVGVVMWGSGGASEIVKELRSPSPGKSISAAFQEPGWPVQSE